VRGRIVWFIGPPATGKSTVARGLVRWLKKQEYPYLWLDSDRLRLLLTPTPTYSEAEREFFYRALAGIAFCAAKGGVFVVISATAHRQIYRDFLKQHWPDLVEVYLFTPLETLKKRDPKGLYQNADKSQHNALPGMGVRFEVPLHPSLVFNTEKEKASGIVNKVIHYCFS
jgi:adenylylsulfate kinase-like enzyme